MGVCGNGADYETLEEAEINKANLFISATGSDELNMLSCFLHAKWVLIILLQESEILNITIKALDL